MAKTSMIEREKRRAKTVKKYAAKRAKLKEQERWHEGRSPIGLPKVRVPKLSMKKKKVKADAAEGEPAKKK